MKCRLPGIREIQIELLRSIRIEPPPVDLRQWSNSVAQSVLRWPGKILEAIQRDNELPVLYCDLLKNAGQFHEIGGGAYALDVTVLDQQPGSKKSSRSLPTQLKGVPVKANPSPQLIVQQTARDLDQPFTRVGAEPLREGRPVIEGCQRNLSDFLGEDAHAGRYPDDANKDLALHARRFSARG